jgi:hypothetical protein
VGVNPPVLKLEQGNQIESGDAPVQLKESDLASGQGWARAGFITGVVVSIAANVARIYVPPEKAPSDWSPPPGAIVAAAFWPIALLISIEIISRVKWPDGLGWQLIRYGGLTAVAAIAAVISYRHMSGLLRAYGEEGIGATIGPLAVDGLMVVSSGALLAIAHNMRHHARAAELAALTADAPASAPPEEPATAHEEPSEPVPEGGAGLAPDLDPTAVLEALRELSANGGASGAKLAAALERRGYEVSERDARRVLALFRPPPARGDDRPEPEAPISEPEPPAEEAMAPTTAEPEPATA